MLPVPAFKVSALAPELFPIDVFELPVAFIFVVPTTVSPASVPTLVSDEVTTPEFKVVPEISAAAFTVKLASGNVIVRVPEGSVMAKVVLFAFAVAPSKTKGDAPAIVVLCKSTLPEVAVKLSAPVVRVNPFEAVSVPAEVTVPLPVEEIFAEVVILFVVEIDPNPEAIDPDESAPEAVSEDVTTFEASVVPEISAAAFTVKVAFGNVIVLLETVGSVIAKIVLIAFAVSPSKTKGDAPAIVVLCKSTVPEVAVTLNAPVVRVRPFEAVRVCVEVSAPLFVVVIPVAPMAIEVAVAVPRFNPAAASKVVAPVEVIDVAP